MHRGPPLTAALVLLAAPAAAQEAPSAPAPTPAAAPAPPPAAPTTSPPAAPAPKAPEPSSGSLLIVLGSLSLAGGVANAASAAACPKVRAEALCYAGSIGLGAGLVVLGVPLVVVGAGQRAVWLQWQAKPVVGGATLQLRGTW